MPPPIDKPFRSLPFLRRPHLRALLLFALTALPIQNEATAQDYFFTTLAGSFGKSGNIDGDRAAATFTHPLHLCRDGKGNIYVTDWLTSPDSGTSVRRITPGGSVTTLARFPRENFSGLAVDRAGAIFVSVGNAIGRIDPTGALLVVAGMRDV